MDTVRNHFWMEKKYDLIYAAQINTIDYNVINKEIHG